MVGEKKKDFLSITCSFDWDISAQYETFNSKLAVDYLSDIAPEEKFSASSHGYTHKSDEEITLNCCYQCAKYTFITIKKV